MIEKMAREIATKAVGADVWDRMASTQRAMFRAQAIGALTALLEPDEAMTKVGWAEASEGADPPEVYVAMIQVASQEA